MKYFFIFGLIIIFLFTFTSLVDASQYKNSELHYSFEVPDGWEEIPQDQIDNQTKIANEMTSNKSVYFRKGYYLKNSNSSEPPYLLIQEKNGYTTFNKVAELYKTKEAEKIVAKVTEKNKLLSGANYANASIDSDKKIIFTNIEIKKENESVIKGLQAIFFGSNSQVTLNFYALDSEFNKYEGDFNKMIESFSFDSNYTYVDRNPMFEGVLSKGLSGVIIGGVFGLFMLIFSKKTKKKPSINKETLNKKGLSINKKIYIATILIAILVSVLILFFYKNNNEKREDTKEQITSSSVSEIDEWNAYYLDSDKYKISFPKEPTKTNGEITVYGDLIPYIKHISSINNTTFSSIYFKTDNLYDKTISEAKENYDPEENSFTRELLLNRRESPWQSLSYVYDILFKESVGSREIEKINNHFYGHYIIDYVWKNANAENFIKGKIIIVNNKDIYILTSENNQDDFKDYEKFVYSWKPFGDLSE